MKWKKIIICAELGQDENVVLLSLLCACVSLSCCHFCIYAEEVDGVPTWPSDPTARLECPHLHDVYFSHLAFWSQSPLFLVVLVGVIVKPKALEFGILPYIRPLNWYCTVYSAVHSTLIYVIPLALALSVTINHQAPLNNLTFHVAPFPFPIRNGSPQVQGSRQESQWHSHRGFQVRADVWAQFQAKARIIFIFHFIRLQFIFLANFTFLDSSLMTIWLLISDFSC